MANILRDHENADVVAGPRDPLFVRARADVGKSVFGNAWKSSMLTNTMPKTVRMIDLMQGMAEGQHGCPVAKTRVAVLSNYL